jgi:PD-(D/E)XK nuclease superfamily
MKNIVLDATALTYLMSCPRKYNYRINNSMVSNEGRSNSIECGSIAHAILEFHNKSRISGKTYDDSVKIGFKAGMEYINGYLPSNEFILDESETGVKNTPEHSDAKNIGWRYVLDTMEAYFTRWRNDDSTKVIVASEEVRGCLLYQDDEIRIIWKAKFDEIDDTNVGFMSVDHKTMKQRRDTLTLNNQFMGQCVVLRARNVVVNKIGFQSSLKPEEKFTRATLSYTADALAEWVNETVPYYARMLVAYQDAGHFPMNICSCETKYGFCDFYQHICTNDRGMRDEMFKVYFVKGKKWDVTND